MRVVFSKEEMKTPTVIINKSREFLSQLKNKRIKVTELPDGGVQWEAVR